LAIRARSTTRRVWLSPRSGCNLPARSRARKSPFVARFRESSRSSKLTIQTALPLRHNRPRPGATELKSRATRVRVPVARIEYLYYAVISYSAIAGYLGIEIPLVAAGMTVALAFSCLVTLGLNATRSILLVLGSLASFVLVQIGMHDVAPLDPVIRSFVLWACGLIVVRSLSLRPGFVQRITLLIFAIGLIAVPSLRFNSSGSVERAAAGIALAGNLRNANGLGAWFGFCLVSFALLGIESRQFHRRTLYWSAAAASLAVVGLSVSRGALLGAALAVAVSCRDILKRGFVPVLLLVLLATVVFQTDLFDRVVSLYEARGLEDTGRLVLWPRVVERIADAPFVGVGVLDIDTYIPEIGQSVSTPHNSFLFFALASGILPFALWTLFWFGAGKRVFFSRVPLNRRRFQLAFFIYGFGQFFLGDTNNDPWVLVTVVVAALPAMSDKRMHALQRFDPRPVLGHHPSINNLLPARYARRGRHPEFTPSQDRGY
jgi:hypothetical protein